MSHLMTERIEWLDNAKALGIFLVFWGHLAETAFYWSAQETTSYWALMQCKIIFSFHMPLFFILSGFFAKKIIKKKSSYCFHKLKKRLFPFYIFNIVLMALWILRDLFSLGGLDPIFYKSALIGYLYGLPLFNWVTWFIACLLVVELIHLLPTRNFSGINILIVSLFFYIAGWLINDNIDFIASTLHIKKFTWFIFEAITAYSFYLIGFYLKETAIFRPNIPKHINALAVLICFTLLTTTFDLNQGPFEAKKLPYVVMAGASHGNKILFPITALCGSLTTIFLAQLMPSTKLVRLVGRNTMMLLGIHHVCQEIQ